MAKAYVPPISIKVPQDRKYAEGWERTFGKKQVPKAERAEAKFLRCLRVLRGGGSFDKMQVAVDGMVEAALGKKSKSPGLSSEVALRMSLPSGSGLREQQKTISGRIQQLKDLKKLTRRVGATTDGKKLTPAKRLKRLAQIPDLKPICDRVMAARQAK